MLKKLALLTTLIVLTSIFASMTAYAADSWPMFKQNSVRTGVDLNAGTMSVSGVQRPAPVWVFPQMPVDNSDTKCTFTGAWTPSSSVTGEFTDGAIGSGYSYLPTVYSAAPQYESWGTDKATWNFTIIAGVGGANYQAYVFFPASATLTAGSELPYTHTTDAHYYVSVDGTVVGRYTVDQSANGGYWVPLGGSTGFDLVEGSHAVTVTLTTETQVTGASTIAVADAVKIGPYRYGKVLSSPVIAPRKDSGGNARPVAVSSVIVDKVLPTSTGQSSTAACSEIYGIFTESTGDGGSVTADYRGIPAWRFPAMSNGVNWLGGSISSTPTIFSNAAYPDELAIVPAGDGEVYAIKTSDGSRVWAGPGHFVWNPTAINTGKKTNPTQDPFDATWSNGTQAGYQTAPGGTDTYLSTPSVTASNISGNAVWTPGVTIPAGTYSIYAWIPPSDSTGEAYVPDASYKVTYYKDAANPEELLATASINQTDGGKWIKICQLQRLTSDILSNISISVQNTSAVAGKYIAADAIKIVPADMSSFQMSSPAVYYDSGTGDVNIYIGNANGRVYALRVNQGLPDGGSPDPTWVYPGTNSDGTMLPALGAIYTSPTFDDNTNPTKMYVGTADGHVYALDRGNGSLLWAYPLAGNDTDGKYYSLGAISSTSVLGSYLYVCTGGDTGSGFTTHSTSGVADGFNPAGRIVALDTTLGATAGTSIVNGSAGRDKWWYPTVDKTAAGSFMYSSPALVNINSAAGTPALVAGSTDGTLYELNPATGAELNTTLPGFASGNLTTPYYSFANVNATIYSSPSVWRAAYSDIANVPLNHEVAYFGTGNGSTMGDLYGVDLYTGIKDWWAELPGSVITSPALYAGRIYAADTGGYTWAFATNVGESWSDSAGSEPSIETSETANHGRTAYPEVEVYTKDQFDTIMKSIYQSWGGGTASTPIDSGVWTDMMQHSPSYNPTALFEWGEKLYVIAWNLLDPNYDSASQTSVLYGQAGFKTISNSRASMVFKSHDPGDNSDSDSSQDMPTTGTFTDSSSENVPYKAYFLDPDGNAVFYNASVYTIDGSNGGWLPGNSISISLSEKAGTSGDVSADVYVPTQHAVPTYDADTSDGLHKAGDPNHALYAPRYMTINNPLGLVYHGASTWLVGMDSETSTSRANALAHINGNHDTASSIPILQPSGATLNDALIPHGSTSAPETLTVCDRSLLGQSSLSLPAVNSSLSKVKVEPEEVEWIGGQGAIAAEDGQATAASSYSSTYLPWEILPNQLPGQVNASPDYPAISSGRFSCEQSGTGINVAVQSMSVPATPTVATGTPPATWTAGQAGVNISLAVPQFQPANEWGTDSDLGTAGYVGKTYVYLDVNNDGHLEKSGALGIGSIIGKSNGANAEPYREVCFNAKVPMDRRTQIDESAVDIGAVPQGFGLSNQSGVPTPFDGANISNLSNLGTSAWKPFFKTFTAHNLGNVNMVNLKVAKYVHDSTGDRPLFLNSDTVENDAAASSPFGIDAFGTNTTGVAGTDAAWLTTTVDRRFDAQNHLSSTPGVTFQKARIGAQSSTLQVPEVNAGMTAIPSDSPALSVAVPIGQPVGTYTGTFTLFEDAMKDDVYDQVTQNVNLTAPVEYAGDPLLKVSVTVDEARVTGYNAASGVGASAPQLDNDPAASVMSKDTSNMCPAIYADPQDLNNIYMFMSSNRINGNVNPANQPWYLYGTHLKTDATSKFGVVFDSSTSWMNALTGTSIIPSISELDTLFPSRVANTEKFFYPSVATDWTSGKSWLFFTGQVTKDLSADPIVTLPGVNNTKTGESLSGTAARTVENRAFYMDISGGTPHTISPISSDLGSAKYALRGIATRLGPDTTNPANDDMYLWSWWYGGGNDKWRIFFNYRNFGKDPSSPTSGQDWGDIATDHRVAQLPLLKGLTSVAEPSPIFRKVLGDHVDVMEVLYSGYSTFHKSSDIYLSRYDINPDHVSNSPATTLQSLSTGADNSVPPIDLPSIVGETLSRAASTNTWWSQHVDWNTDKTLTLIMKYDTHTLTMPAGKLDPTSGTIVFKDPETDTALNTNTVATADPVTGSIKLVRMPKNITSSPKIQMYLSYTPRAYRLTSGPGSNVSPYALLDKDDNPRYQGAGPTLASPFVVPTGWTGNPRRDRLWLFWRRPGADKSGTGVVYKAFRETVQLNHTLGSAGVPTVTVSGVVTPVEIDWMKNRLYFMSDEDGKQVTVSYNDVQGISRSDTVTVQLKEEPFTETAQDVWSDDLSRQAFNASLGIWPQTGPVGNAPFSSVTRVMVNEGQVCAFKDPNQDKVWIAWSSTRSGSTDIYYEAISPRFYGTETAL